MCSKEAFTGTPSSQEAPHAEGKTKARACLGVNISPCTRLSQIHMYTEMYTHPHQQRHTHSMGINTVMCIHTNIHIKAMYTLRHVHTHWHVYTIDMRTHRKCAHINVYMQKMCMHRHTHKHIHVRKDIYVCRELCVGRYVSTHGNGHPQTGVHAQTYDYTRTNTSLQRDVCTLPSSSMLQKGSCKAWETRHLGFKPDAAAHLQRDFKQDTFQDGPQVPKCLNTS